MPITYKLTPLKGYKTMDNPRFNVLIDLPSPSLVRPIHRRLRQLHQQKF